MIIPKPYTSSPCTATPKTTHFLSTPFPELQNRAPHEHHKKPQFQQPRNTDVNFLGLQSVKYFVLEQKQGRYCNLSHATTRPGLSLYTEHLSCRDIRSIPRQTRHSNVDHRHGTLRRNELSCSVQSFAH
ncbi:hypothetical protein KC19_10G163300 [Ceratodon purpureus]|uniref:Uncharacterized protein n=1 Tax=Ceratodon purpureus TaxID=3225 RepID=A0A8T0GNP6_CERPU|nr:hypothetical protein KC19_10G163300 [Ceratodon purpureus]